ncbi:unnamed protein product [Lupinus luteus]|uniref:Uncharacterized protein n=1 Tax=Lupinus luteus TaxID=3873 RepID=A0AAV1VXX1_LUPLU
MIVHEEAHFLITGSKNENGTRTATENHMVGHEEAHPLITGSENTMVTDEDTPSPIEMARDEEKCVKKEKIVEELGKMKEEKKKEYVVSLRENNENELIGSKSVLTPHFTRKRGDGVEISDRNLRCQVMKPKFASTEGLSPPLSPCRSPILNGIRPDLSVGCQAFATKAPAGTERGGGVEISGGKSTLSGNETRVCFRERSIATVEHVQIAGSQRNLARSVRRVSGVYDGGTGGYGGGLERKR